MKTSYSVGDRVIYRVVKYTTHPGPRAAHVAPAPQGDRYTYTVDKFWRVRETLPDGQLVLETRNGKTHVISPTDPSLRRPNWWERLWYGGRFPQREPKVESHV